MISLDLLANDWNSVLKNEFEKSYLRDLNEFLDGEKNKIIFPSQDKIFAAFNTTSFRDVKVVILGQDPYPTPGHAMGLAFSADIKTLPKSLKNIYKELQDDIGVERNTGSLLDWAEQGVLLLNAVLTVESGKANSHANKGWEQFTDAVIQTLNDKKEGLVFVLWGSYAQKKGKYIDREKHFVIESVHPSPLSAYRGFYGSKPFSKINENVKINW